MPLCGTKNLRTTNFLREFLKRDSSFLVTYSFSYGNFALRSSIQIGSRTLASYTYSTDGIRYLTSLDYGNEDSVDFSCDDNGMRISRERSTKVYDYVYNGSQ